MDLFQYSGVRFDVRVNDRNFQKDDYLLFREYDNQAPFKYKERALVFQVSYTLSGWGVSPGHIALGLLPVEDGKAVTIADCYAKIAYPHGFIPSVGIRVHPLSTARQV
jgi:hypothetical protein